MPSRCLLLLLLVMFTWHEAWSEPCQDRSSASKLATHCGFAWPEDVEFVPDHGVVIISEQGFKAPIEGGALSAAAIDSQGGIGSTHKLWSPSEPLATQDVVGDRDCTSPPAQFAPHGLGVGPSIRGTTRIAVVAHGSREAIELFDLTGTGSAATLRWRGCVVLPPDTAGNDVAVHPDGLLFVTNYIPTTRGIAALLASARAIRGEDTGDVIVWSASRGWRHLPGTQGAMLNGLVLDDSKSSLYVAESGRGRVRRFVLAGDALTPSGELATGGVPDNLNWTRRGTLLLSVLDRKVVTQWQLHEIDPVALTSRIIVTDEAATIHSVTAATDTGRAIVFGSMRDDRIAVMPWRNATLKDSQ
jgi:hypothetical protein